jgi:hypothetical protein
MTRARERTLCLLDAPARRTGIPNLFLPHCNTRTGCYGSLQLIVRMRETIFRSFCIQRLPVSSFQSADKHKESQYKNEFESVKR